MKDLENLIPEDLYHSYIVEGDIEQTLSAILNLFKKRGYIKNIEKDSFIKSYDSFSIDDSRIVKEWHSRKKTGEEKRFFIIGSKFINHDAERALLKILEEPSEDTHFFIIVPDSSLLLDTILSRAHLIRENKDNNISEEAKKFLKSSKKDRIDMIALILKKNENNEDSGGLRHDSINLLNNLEIIIHENFKKNPRDLNFITSLEEINKSKDYLSLPGSSAKMILEHIALVI